MRKLTHLLLAIGLVLGLASTASAGTFVPLQSPLKTKIGGLPTITTPAALPGSEASVGLTDQLTAPFGHFIGVGNTVWSTVNIGAGTSLFTGVPAISNLKLTAINQQGNVQDGFTSPSNPLSNGAMGVIGPTFGGHIRLDGQAVISALGLAIPVGIGKVGGNFGETTTATIGGFATIVVENGPQLTTAIMITGITSNLISLPNRTGQKTGVGFTLDPTASEFVRTFNTTGGFQSLTGSLKPAAEATKVTVSGTNNLASGSMSGVVTVVAPQRIDVDTIAGIIPGAFSMTLSFVPEPGTLLLLASGAVGIAVIGHRRMRSRK